MISTLLTLLVGIYAGLFLAKNGITLAKAIAPVRATFLLLCKWISATIKKVGKAENRESLK